MPGCPKTPWLLTLNFGLFNDRNGGWWFLPSVNATVGDTMARTKRPANARVIDTAVVTDAMKQSGEWVRESAVLEVTGIHATTLRDKRQQGLIRALPATRGPSGYGRSFWYSRSDVEEIVARRNAKVTREIDSWDAIETLQLSMAQGEVRELELARARDERLRLEGQIRELAEENRRLRAGLAALNAGMAEILGLDRDSYQRSGERKPDRSGSGGGQQSPL